MITTNSIQAVSTGVQSHETESNFDKACHFLSENAKGVFQNLVTGALSCALVSVYTRHPLAVIGGGAVVAVGVCGAMNLLGARRVRQVESESDRPARPSPLAQKSLASAIERSGDQGWRRVLKDVAITLGGILGVACSLVTGYTGGTSGGLFMGPRYSSGDFAAAVILAPFAIVSGLVALGIGYGMACRGRSAAACYTVAATASALVGVALVKVMPF